MNVRFISMNATYQTPEPNPEQDKTRPRQHDHGVPLASAVGGANTDPATSPIGLIGGGKVHVRLCLKSTCTDGFGHQSGPG